MKEVRNQKLVYFASPYRSANPVVVAKRFVDIHKIVEQVLLDFPVIIPFSPIVYTHQFGHLGIRWLDRMDYFMLDISNVLIVVQLDDWLESEGVKKEIDYALDNDIPIYYAPPCKVMDICKVIEEDALKEINISQLEGKSEQSESVLNDWRARQNRADETEQVEAKSDEVPGIEDILSTIKDRLAKLEYSVGVHDRQIVELQRDYQAEITFLQTDVQSLKTWLEQQEDE